MFHKPHARIVGHPLRQQAVDQRHDAAEHVRQNGKHKLDDQQQAEPIQPSAIEPLLQRLWPIRHLDELYHIVDYEFADEQRDDRQQRTHQPQRERSCGEMRARVPHHREERSKVLERSDTLFQRPFSDRHRRLRRQSKGAGPLSSSSAVLPRHSNKACSCPLGVSIVPKHGALCKVRKPSVTNGRGLTFRPHWDVSGLSARPLPLSTPMACRGQDVVTVRTYGF